MMMYVYYVVCVCEGLGQVLLALVMSEGRSGSWLMLEQATGSCVGVKKCGGST